MTHYDDVRAFHDRFAIPRSGKPQRLGATLGGPERLRHLIEEVQEYASAVERGDLVGQADALVDLVYVAIGNAIIQGLPWQELWDEVQRANMAKVRDPSVPKRVVKPPSWRPPDIARLLYAAGWEADAWTNAPPAHGPGEGWAK